MGAGWYVTTRIWRRRWRGVLVLAALTAVTGGLAAVGPPIDRRYAVVQLAPGADASQLADAIQQSGLPATAAAVGRPADVENVARLRQTPLILLGLLGLSVVFAVLHALLGAFRDRRHDLAVLRACGCGPGQVRSTSVAQALTIAAVALVIGIPVGVIAGRLSWTLLAHELGVVAQPSVPIGSGVVLAAAVLALASLAGLLAGWYAARTSPAVALRVE